MAANPRTAEARAAGWDDGMLYCYGGCGLRYMDFPCDVSLPTPLWNRIAVGAPFDEAQEGIEREGRGGVLCPACIVQRLAALPDCSVIGMDLGTDWRRLAQEAQVHATQSNAELAAQAAEIARLQARASRLEDAAFHFQTCATCAQDGEESCQSGRVFAAYLRGEDAIMIDTSGLEAAADRACVVIDELREENAALKASCQQARAQVEQIADGIQYRITSIDVKAWQTTDQQNERTRLRMWLSSLATLAASLGET